MPRTTIGFGAILIAIGLFGYFGSDAETPSKTALIPAVFGVILGLCGGLALARPKLRMHTMHVAALVALVGVIAAGVRLAPRIGNLASDDLTIARPARMTFLMGLACLVFLGMTIQSFIAARRRRANGGIAE